MQLRADILTPDGILENAKLEVDRSGQISAVIPSGIGDMDFDFSGALIVPGFIDLHVHGGGGSDFMEGTVEAVRTVARTHVKYGTTSLLATTLTADRESIDKAISAIVEVIENPGDDEATIRGIHLEGPYICSKRRGAQPQSPIRPPDISELDHWQELSGGRIRQITLAPEIPGALEFIEHAAAIGVNVSMGHTDASDTQINSAVAAGASQGTHLFNAMSPMSHRSPGAVGGMLTNDSVFCELICDGFHVDPLVLKVAFRSKGPDKILLITDAMSGAAMPDGNYNLGGRTVIVNNGSAKMDDGTLAGSVLTMNESYWNIIKFTGASSVEAARMSSLNASTRLGLTDQIGTIGPGRQADLAILDQTTRTTLAVMISGRLVYSAWPIRQQKS